ncbi:N-acetyltransferase [Nocardioides marmoriginsengisoli]|uniref:N-acetyltransferase n=2 Tax=Nocardioides marmoriginsengisoli TaxID=661483 RepID=A0A3N0CC38_9ACTN|nr:N-acetyltransferase [Nocardioides marmoriginsengisoli]
MFEEADIEALWRIRSDPAVAEWMTSLTGELAPFAELICEPVRMASTLVVELDGRIIGDLMFRTEDPWAQAEVKEQAAGKQAELGWCFAPEVQGNGYATESVAELIRIAFAEVGLHRVTANCFTANAPSWRIMERVGMRREAHSIKDALHRDHGWCDGFVYALLAEEWRATVG